MLTDSPVDLLVFAVLYLDDHHLVLCAGPGCPLHLHPHVCILHLCVLLLLLPAT